MVKEKSQFEEYKYAILIIGGSILVTILLASILGSSLWKDMKKNSKLAAEAKEELTMLETKLENLKNLSAKEAEIKNQNTKVLAALPADKDIPRLFVQFENVAAQSGIAVSQVSESVANAPSTTQTGLIIPVSYLVNTVASDYSSLKNVLGNFEKALRIVSIDGFTATKSETGIAINFNITTYKRGTDE